MEQQLILKRYYETYTEGIENTHPIEIIGEKFAVEQMNDSFDLSDLRFAQGELYYEAKDYETAIFKWQKVQNELQLWAQKNIADAYVELKQFSQAEELYHSIQTVDNDLTMEIALQLFSMYIMTKKFTEADTTIKRAVSFNPDYPNVTYIARAFYEQQQDWMSAIELAKDEALRTNSLEWFAILQSYVESDITKHTSPRYFYDCLLALHTVDHEQFEQFVSSLWNHYEDEPLYLEWLTLINEALLNIQIDANTTWDIISTHFEAAYKTLTTSNYLLKQIQSIMPDFFMNWLRVTNPSQSLFASAATLAWNERFPDHLGSFTINDANDLFDRCSASRDSFAYAANLFEDVIHWLELQHVQVPEGLLSQGYQMINEHNHRTVALLAIVKEILVCIWDERKKYINNLTESITWNEEIVEKLSGFIANLKEMEQDKVNAIVRTYVQMKEELKTDLQENIPSILKGCINMITEDSDFSRLHLELNKEMNRRLYEYLQERISHRFSFAAHQWVTESSEEFIEVEAYLEDMSKSFNALYQEDKLNLQVDFRTLDDWHRDINRMTSRIKMDELNILLRFTPSQVLLKSAGKLFGPIVQNKSMLYSKYKNYIKTRSYEEVTEGVMNNLFLQFELFENALDRDVAMFFETTFQTLNQIVTETNKETTTKKEILQKLLDAPEVYTDPLTLFEVRLQQYELMTSPEKQVLQ